MNSFVRNIAIKSFTFLMIGVMGLLIANKGLFTHTHKLENGTLVTHAHPYDKKQDSEPYKKHPHTKYEFLFLESLSTLFLSIVLILSILLLVRKKVSFVDFEKIYIRPFAFSYLGRAPPVS